MESKFSDLPADVPHPQDWKSLSWLERLVIVSEIARLPVHGEDET